MHDYAKQQFIEHQPEYKTRLTIEQQKKELKEACYALGARIGLDAAKKYIREEFVDLLF